MKEKNQRIWEIDALRGFLILCVIAAHALFYLSQIRRAFALPPTVAFVIHYGGMLFVVLSGLSATLGRRSFRRGLTVFAGGMALTLGSLAAASFGWMDESMIIRFGVLHLLGFVMMVYPLLKKLPSPVLLVFGLAVIAVGYWFELDNVLVRSHILFPLGLSIPALPRGIISPLHRILAGSALESCWAGRSMRRNEPGCPASMRSSRSCVFSDSAVKTPFGYFSCICLSSAACCSCSEENGRSC